MKVRQLIVLCGGTGSRLGDETKLLPKPMIKVFGIPYLNFLVQELAQLPIDEIIFLAGYKSNIIKEEFDKKIINGVNLRVLEEKRPRGTLGALVEHKRHLNKNFILCNADTVWRYDTEKLYLSIKNLDNDYSYIFATEKKEGHRYGSIKIVDGFITFFGEKIEIDQNVFFNSGLYVMNKDHLSQAGIINNDKKLDLERDLFQSLSQVGKLKSVTGVISYFHDFGTPEALLELSGFIKEKFNKKFIVFDRDNTINIDTGYISYPEKTELCKNFIENIDLIKKSNRALVIVSNQGGIALGKFNSEQNIKFYQELKQQLADYGLFILEYLFCPHHPSVYECNCRKPSPRMLLEWKINTILDWESAVVIGDSDLDQKLSENINADFVRVTVGQSYRQNLMDTLNDSK